MKYFLLYFYYTRFQNYMQINQRIIMMKLLALDLSNIEKAVHLYGISQNLRLKYRTSFILKNTKYDYFTITIPITLSDLT